MRITLEEFRQAYPPSSDISSPHLPVEIANVVVSSLDDVSEKPWDVEKQAALLDVIINAATIVIGEYRAVYPPAMPFSSPHIPRIIAIRIAGLVDDIVHEIRKEKRVLSVTSKPIVSELKEDDGS